MLKPNDVVEESDLFVAVPLERLPLRNRTVDRLGFLVGVPEADRLSSVVLLALAHAGLARRDEVGTENGWACS